MRLDHLIAKRERVGERRAREIVAMREVSINGTIVTDHRTEVSKFDEIVISQRTLQSALDRLYIKLHKPAGIVSATTDPAHTTVIDLIDHPLKDTLHLAGRLDRSSTGLVLLTNDSTWSEALTSPDHDVPKVYLVETVDPIPSRAIAAFEAGFHFMPEDLHTRPAELEILGERTARVTLHEGRWHQIKRMFHRLDENRLVSLHRESIGEHHLDDLPPGKWIAINL